MTWIDTVPEDGADTAVQRTYDACVKQFGFVPNIRRALSINPEAMRAYVHLSGAVYGGGVLPAVEREMVAIVVSATNRCRY